MLLLSGVSVIRRAPKLFLVIPALIAAASIAGCDREKQASGQAGAEQRKTSAPEGKAAAGGGAVSGFAHEVVRTHKGKPAPAVHFLGPDDAPVSLSDFRGKPLLVNLWATWCAPCVAEMPTLDRLAANSGERMTVIAVAQDLKGAEVVDPWFQKAGLTTLQPFLDPKNGLLDAANSGLPTTFLYDAQGREVWRVIGAIDWQGAEAAALLAEVGA